MATASNDSFKIIKLDNKNYPSWKVQITSVLKAKLLYQYCSSEIESSNEQNMAKNEAAKSLMLTAMDTSIISAYGDCNTAHEMWKKIQETYQGTDKDYKNSLLTDFYDLKLNNEPIAAYISRFLEKTGQLSAIGHYLEEDTKVCIFKKGLVGSKYFSRAETWLIANNDGRISELISTMRAGPKNEDKKENIALLGQDKKDKTCTYCNKTGHTWKECFSRLRKNKSKNYKGDYNNERRGTRSNEKFDKNIKSYKINEPEALMAISQ